MLVSGSPSLAAKGRHGQAATDPPERYSLRMVHIFEKIRFESPVKYVGFYGRRRESVVKYVGLYGRRRESVVKYVGLYARRRENVVKYVGRYGRRPL